MKKPRFNGILQLGDESMLMEEKPEQISGHLIAFLDGK